ncbi:MAG: Fic family protein [Chloroflexota bacterium]
MSENRTYQETHPWLTFQVDLRKVNFNLWFLLGAVQAKCEQVAGVPLLPDVADELHRIFLAKGALATTAIEGNTLSEPEAYQLLKGELNLPPSKSYLGQEIENVIAACNLIADDIFSGTPTTLTSEKIQEFNELILKNLPLNEDVYPGQIRTHQVMVGRYRGAPPEDCAYLLQRLCQWLNEDFTPPSTQTNPSGYKIAFGLLKAIVAHLYIAWIHPFGDGNGRTARMLEFQILLSCGVPSTSAHLLSNFYNQTRTEYYRQLDYASRSGGDIVPFVQYAMQGFLDGLNEQLQMIEEQQLHVHWVNYVHTQFRDMEGATDIRRRRLVLDLTEQDGPVPITELRYISPRIAEAYAGKTDKTIQRDVNTLVQMNLIRRTGKGIQVRQELMYAFLPTSNL